MLILYAVYFARSLLAPIVVAFLVYLTLRPVVGQLYRYRIPAPAASVLLLILFLILLGLSIATVIDPARQLATSLPNQIATLRIKMRDVDSPFAAIRRASEEVEMMAEEDGVQEEAPIPVEVQQPEWSSSMVLLNGTGSVVGFAVMVIALSFFLLATGDSLINRLLHVLPSFGERRRVVELIVDLQTGVSHYLGQVTLINAGLGITVGVGLYLMGMPTPMLWGVMAMLLNYIPFIGALIGASVIFLAATTEFDALSWTLATTGVYLMLTTIEGQFITPTLLGRAFHLSPFMVLLSVCFWGWMWGLIGIFVAVPLLIVVRMLCEHFPTGRVLAVLIGADEEMLTASRQSEEESDNGVETRVTSGSQIGMGFQPEP